MSETQKRSVCTARAENRPDGVGTGEVSGSGGLSGEVWRPIATTGTAAPHNSTG